MRYLVIVLALLFISCRNKIDSKVKQINSDLVNVGVYIDEKYIEQEALQTQFYIKNKNQYSETFLIEFQAKHSIYKAVSLIGDTIMINNDRENVILIPTDLPLDKNVTYEERVDGIKYQLTVRRINYSTIEYSYLEIVNNKMRNARQGLADIEPVFYFGAEGTFEDGMGNVYGMNEYIDSFVSDCKTFVYIGVGSIEKTFMKHSCVSEIDMFETPLLTIKK